MKNVIFSTRNIDELISDIANEIIRKLELLNNSSEEEILRSQKKSKRKNHSKSQKGGKPMT